MAQVGVHGLRAGDAQQRAAQRDPASVAVADEEQEQVVRRQRLEDGCRRPGRGAPGAVRALQSVGSYGSIDYSSLSADSKQEHSEAKQMTDKPECKSHACRLQQLLVSAVSCMQCRCRRGPPHQGSR